MTLVDSSAARLAPECGVARRALGVKHLTHLAACLLKRQGEPVVLKRQVEQGDKEVRGLRRDDLTQIHRDLRNDRNALVLLGVIGLIQGEGQRGVQQADRRCAVRVRPLTDRGVREGQLGHALVAVVVLIRNRHTEGFLHRVVALLRRIGAVQLEIAVLTFREGKFRVARTDAAVVLNRLAAQSQVLKQHRADKLIKSVSVTQGVLILHINRLFVPADGKQISVVVLRAHVVLRNIRKRENNRRTLDKIVMIGILVAGQTDTHLRESDECKLRRLLQQDRVNRLGHADNVSRCARQIAMGRIHKNRSISVSIQNFVRKIGNLRVHKH